LPFFAVQHAYASSDPHHGRSLSQTVSLIEGFPAPRDRIGITGRHGSALIEWTYYQKSEALRFR
jgi:hypothetical protein